MKNLLRTSQLLALVLFSALLLAACDEEPQPSPDAAPESEVAVPAEATTAVTAPASIEIPEQLPERQAQLEQLAGLAYNTGQHEEFLRVMKKLNEIESLNPEYNYQLAIAYALLDNKPAAYETMLNMQRQGMAFDFNQNPDTVNIRDTELYEFVNNMMLQAAEGAGNSEVFVTLPEDFLLAEALAWDGTNDRLLVGSVADGRILSVSSEGDIEEFAEPGDWWSIYDLLVDEESNTLWASTAARLGFSGLSADNRGRTALIAFDLDSGVVRNRVLLPSSNQPQALANLVQMKNGDLLVADALQPLIYRLPTGESTLKPYFGSPKMGSLRGLARSEDGRLLFVADHRRGLLVLDTEAEKLHPLAIPESLNLFGIDGVTMDGNAVIVIQSGFIPERVMRLELNEAMDKVENVVALQVNGELLDSPTFGVIGGEQFYYIGNSHWPYLASERGFGDRTPPPTRLLKVDKDEGANIFAPTLEDLSRAIPGARQINIPDQKASDSADEETNQN